MFPTLNQDPRRRHPWRAWPAARRPTTPPRLFRSRSLRSVTALMRACHSFAVPSLPVALSLPGLSPSSTGSGCPSRRHPPRPLQNRDNLPRPRYTSRHYIILLLALEYAHLYGNILLHRSRRFFVRVGRQDFDASLSQGPTLVSRSLSLCSRRCRSTKARRLTLSLTRRYLRPVTLSSTVALPVPFGLGQAEFSRQIQPKRPLLV